MDKFPLMACVFAVEINLIFKKKTHACVPPPLLYCVHFAIGNLVPDNEAITVLDSKMFIRLPSQKDSHTHFSCHFHAFTPRRLPKFIFSCNVTLPCYFNHIHVINSFAIIRISHFRWSDEAKLSNTLCFTIWHHVVVPHMKILEFDHQHFKRRHIRCHDDDRNGFISA